MAADEITKECNANPHVKQPVSVCPYNIKRNANTTRMINCISFNIIIIHIVTM